MKSLRTYLEDSWKYLRLWWCGRRDGHYLKPRYGMDEKPAGWNRAVLGWFMRGPELRQPTDDFRDAFHKGAQQPPPRAIVPGMPRSSWWKRK